MTLHQAKSVTKASVETVEQDILRSFVQNLSTTLIFSTKITPFRKCLLFLSSGANDTKRMPLSYNAVYLPGICLLFIQIKNQTTHFLRHPVLSVWQYDNNIQLF
jgi:hypothetical protein